MNYSSTQNDDDHAVPELSSRARPYGDLFVMPGDVDDESEPCDINDWVRHHRRELDDLYGVIVSYLQRDFPGCKFNHIALFKEFVKLAWRSSPQRL